MPSFGFHIRHGDHSSEHNIDLPDARTAHKEATMIFGDFARDVAAHLNETPEWRMDVSDESGKCLFRLRLLTEPLE
jgi:uncharacterized protein DUF6894